MACSNGIERASLLEHTMKVAIIDPLGGHGGHHYYVDGIATGLQKAGMEITVYTVGETAIRGNEPYRIEVVFRGLYGSDPALLRGLRYVRGLFRSVFLAWHQKCRIVHLHFFLGDLREYLAVLVARAAGMRVVATVHDVENFGRPRMTVGLQRVARHCSALIVHNSFSRDRLMQASRTRDIHTLVTVIPHGHYFHNYPDMPDRWTARARLGLPADKTIFLFFGNPREEKGLDLLLRAMGHLRDSKTAMLLVAGKMKAELAAQCRTIIEEEGIGAITRLDVGHVSDRDLPFYFSAADLVVAPYRRIYESGVALMAMSFGRAVLASNLPPLTELTDNGTLGLLFTSNNTADLARALQEAIDKRPILDALGERAKARVLAERGWDAIGRQTAALYNRVCPWNEKGQRT